jgi:CheY-like chemotaxis protein
MVYYSAGYSTTKLLNTGIHFENACVYFASLLEKVNQLANADKAGNKLIPLRILLADDDEDDRQLFEEAISHIHPGLQIENAETGYDLLKKLATGQKPDIVFLDLNMPGKNGKECLAEIRSNKNWKDIPVIIYSTSFSKKDISDTYIAGANLYLLKPTSFPELIQRIRQSFSFDWDKKPRIDHNDFVLNN